MPHWLSVVFLLAAGAGLLGVAYHAHRTGRIRAGSHFLHGVYRPSRADNPFSYHAYLALYFAAGLALCVWGLLALLGMAPDLRWR